MPASPDEVEEVLNNNICFEEDATWVAFYSFKEIFSIEKTMKIVINHLYLLLFYWEHEFFKKV